MVNPGSSARRRTLAAIIGALALASLGRPAAAQSGNFTIILLPDTQIYAESYPAIFTSQTQWIANNKAAMNIIFVLHEGDITNSNNGVQWDNAYVSISVLDGVVPYALAAGNHDFGLTGGADTRDTTFFNYYFPVSRYADLPTFGGLCEPRRMENSFHLFSAGGINWLLLVLEFGPRDDVLTWANQVVAAHPSRRTMIVTHTYLYSDDTLHGSVPTHSWNPHGYGVGSQPGGANDGVEMWEKLVRKHANISLVFNGHILNDGAGRLLSTGDGGNNVYQMLANYQMIANGGDGYLRIVEFDPALRKVSVRTYSPYLDLDNPDPQHEFEFTNVDFFAPADATAPTAPGSLTAAAAGVSQIDLTWTAATDADGGIAYYVIYRDGAEVTSATGTSFSDTGLAEATSYGYEVSAANLSGLEGPKAGPVTETTLADAARPTIESVTAYGDPAEVLVVFSEPVEQASAEVASNYQVDNGIAVSSASLGADGRTVALTTSTLSEGITYILTVNNVKDRAMTPNEIEPDTQETFTYAGYVFLLSEDFDDGDMQGWTVVDEGTTGAPSDWSVQSQALVQSSNIYDTIGRRRRGTFAYWDDPGALAWTDYTYEVTLRSADDDGIGVMFRYRDAGNYYKLDMDSQRVFCKLFRMKDGVETALAGVPLAYTPGVDMALKITASGDQVTVELDGTVLFGGPVADGDLSAGTVALYCWGNTGAAFDDVVVTALPSKPGPGGEDEPGCGGGCGAGVPVIAALLLLRRRRAGAPKRRRFAGGTS